VLVIGKAIVFVLYLVFLAYAVILGIAFFLRLFGANADADFADWIFRASARIMEPFRGIFPTTQISDRSEFDASLLFALVIYLVAAIALHGIVHWFSRKISRADIEQERRRYWSSLATAPAPAPTPVAPAPAAPAPVAPAPAAPAPVASAPAAPAAAPATIPSEAASPATSIAPTIADLPPNAPMSGANGPLPGVPSDTNASNVARSDTGPVGRVNPPMSPFPPD
jgi:hypothetical protein